MIHLIFGLERVACIRHEGCYWLTFKQDVCKYYQLINTCLK